MRMDQLEEGWARERDEETHRRRDRGGEKTARRSGCESGKKNKGNRELARVRHSSFEQGRQHERNATVVTITHTYTPHAVGIAHCTMLSLRQREWTTATEEKRKRIQQCDCTDRTICTEHPCAYHSPSDKNTYTNRDTTHANRARTASSMWQWIDQLGGWGVTCGLPLRLFVVACLCCALRHHKASQPPHSTTPSLSLASLPHKSVTCTITRSQRNRCTKKKKTQVKEYVCTVKWRNGRVEKRDGKEKEEEEKRKSGAVKRRPTRPHNNRLCQR